MEQRSSPFRLILIPPLAAMGLAAAIAYWLSNEAPPAQPVNEPEPAPVAAPTPVTPAPRAEAPKVAQPSALPPPAATAPAAPPQQRPNPSANLPAALQDPKVLDHAKLMVVESAKLYLHNSDLANLMHLRSTLREQGIEPALAPADLTGIEIGIECLQQTAEAKSRAFEFLEDNAGSPLADGLRFACR